MWLTAEIHHFWQNGYTYTEWGGVAHAIPSHTPYNILKILQYLLLYKLTI
jgi:hypothetical protein